MARFNIGDRVRIKDIPDWPKPPGFRFAGAEGTVVHSDFDELMEKFLDHMVCIKLEKGADSIKEHIVDYWFWFLTDDVEKI